MTEKEKYVLDHYEITEDGKVFSCLNSNNNFKRRQLKFRTDKDGYFDVSLVCDKDGNRMPFRIHRLVTLKYLNNPNNYPVVNHKDSNKKNNKVENLEWCSIAYNTQHGYDNCAYQSVKQVIATEPDGTQRIFPSQSHAARFYKYKNSSVISSLIRKNKSVSKGFRKGFKFEYAN